jgi:putative transposase
MRRRKTTKAAEAAAPNLSTVPNELLGQFVSDPMSAEAVQAASMAF